MGSEMCIRDSNRTLSLVHAVGMIVVYDVLSFVAGIDYINSLQKYPYIYCLQYNKCFLPVDKYTIICFIL